VGVAVIVTDFEGSLVRPSNAISSPVAAALISLMPVSLPVLTITESGSNASGSFTGVLLFTMGVLELPQPTIRQVESTITTAKATEMILFIKNTSFFLSQEHGKKCLI
jgi:hypothetical protein